MSLYSWLSIGRDDLLWTGIDKVERTLFMLDWLENPGLRRRCHAGLNNSEQRHALTQAIYTFRQGRIIDRSQKARQYRASGLNPWRCLAYYPRHVLMLCRYEAENMC